MTSFEKKVWKALQSCESFSEAVDCLLENDYCCSDTCDESNAPTKFEAYFEYEGDEKTTDGFSFDIWPFFGEDVYEMYDAEDEEEDAEMSFDELCEMLSDECWEDLDEFVEKFVVFGRDNNSNQIICQSVPDDQVAQWQNGYDNWCEGIE